MTRNFTDKSKIQIFLRTAICQAEGCNTPLADGVEWDHIDPWANSHDRTPENGQALCPACHKLKTNGPKHYSKGSDKSNQAAIKRHQRGPKESKYNWPSRKLESKPFKTTWRPKTKYLDEPTEGAK